MAKKMQVRELNSPWFIGSRFVGVLFVKRVKLYEIPHKAFARPF